MNRSLDLVGFDINPKLGWTSNCLPETGWTIVSFAVYYLSED